MADKEVKDSEEALHLKNAIPDKARKPLADLIQLYIKEKKLSPEDSFHLKYLAAMITSGGEAMGRAYDRGKLKIAPIIVKNKVKKPSKKEKNEIAKLTEEFKILMEERNKMISNSLTEFEKNASDPNQWKYDPSILNDLKAELTKLDPTKQIESQFAKFFDWAKTKTNEKENPELHNLITKQNKNITKGMVHGFVFNMGATYFENHFKPSDSSEQRTIAAAQSNFIKRIAIALYEDNTGEAVVQNIVKSSKGLGGLLVDPDLFAKVKGAPSTDLKDDITKVIQKIITSQDFPLLTTATQIRLLTELKDRLTQGAIEEAKKIFTPLIDAHINQIQNRTEVKDRAEVKATEEEFKKAREFSLYDPEGDLDKAVKQTAANVDKMNDEKKGLTQSAPAQLESSKEQPQELKGFSTSKIGGSLARHSGKHASIILGSKPPAEEKAPEEAPKETQRRQRSSVIPKNLEQPKWNKKPQKQEEENKEERRFTIGGKRSPSGS